MEDCVSSLIYLLIQITYLYQYGLVSLFYTSNYNPMLCYSSCSSFGSWKLFKLSPDSFWDAVIVCVCVRAHVPVPARVHACMYFLTFWYCKMLQGHFIGFLPLSIFFFKEPWLLLLENGIRNQKLGNRSAHCYWDIIASVPEGVIFSTTFFEETMLWCDQMGSKLEAAVWRINLHLSMLLCVPVWVSHFTGEPRFSLWYITWGFSVLLTSFTVTKRSRKLMSSENILWIDIYKDLFYFYDLKAFV